MSTSAPAALACLLIADDLTGACDASVPFAMAGCRTMACLGHEPDFAQAEVLAISTDTRDAEPSSARRVVLETALALASAYSPAILFKKIDSTLRGNLKQEIAAVSTAFACDAVIVCPAFPKLGRMVADGRLHVQGSLDQPIEILGRLNDPCLEPAIAVRREGIGEAISAGARVVVVDASSDTDLDELVTSTQVLNRRILWVGSGGLASALTRALKTKSAKPSEPLPKGPVVFCVGSEHAATAAQQAHFRAHHSVKTVSLSGIDPRELAMALEQGRHLWIQVPRDPGCLKELGRLLGTISPAAILLSGGFTASLVHRAVGATSIDVRDEILPGIPYGVLRGGVCAGRIVVTKSGAFGGPDTLSRIAHFFS